MKCQIQFSRKNKKNIISWSSAESAHSMVSVKAPCKTVVEAILMSTHNMCFYGEL